MMVNAELVRQGYAQAATFPPDVKYQQKFSALQKEAQTAGRGLWQRAATAPKGANLRGGPGTNYPVVGGVKAGAALSIAARNAKGDWYQLASGAWIAAYLVADAPAGLPVASVIPTPPATKPTKAVVPPKTRSQLSPGSVAIASVNYDGAVRRVESDEYAVVQNTGGTAVDVTGWLLNAGDGGQDFVFPGGFVLQPGQSCRIYTNEYHPETCGLTFGSGRAIWNNDGDCGLLFNQAGQRVSEYCY